MVHNGWQRAQLARVLRRRLPAAGDVANKRPQYDPSNETHDSSLEKIMVIDIRSIPGSCFPVGTFAAARDIRHGAAATAALIESYPNSGMLIAAQIGPKVAQGEMTWG